ncbi:hypothetical protein Micbo1qcDRAFT_170392 [Microdochium bolleyi]|uniref:Uncharacterized protein n=1 Tax=Microdochium bolleyi TaxID=196109 RepID=A0A136JHE8_9PEZI|nr:hypothetical protein Micbo1qcDRAFT_170392 [Microdochium bolleyi]
MGQATGFHLEHGHIPNRRVQLLEPTGVIFRSSKAPKGLFAQNAEIRVHKCPTVEAPSWLYLEFYVHDPWPGDFATFHVIVQAASGVPNPCGFVETPSFNNSAGSAAAVDTVRRWLNNCETNHDNCRTSNEVPLPTRVLDVGGPDPSVVALFSTQGAAGLYVCLSYCWGTIPFTKTTQANLGMRWRGTVGTALRRYVKLANFVTDHGYKRFEYATVIRAECTAADAFHYMESFSDRWRWVNSRMEGKYFVIRLVTIDTGSYETFNGIVVETQHGGLVRYDDEDLVMV